MNGAAPGVIGARWAGRSFGKFESSELRGAIQSSRWVFGGWGQSLRPCSGAERAKFLCGWKAWKSKCHPAISTGSRSASYNATACASIRASTRRPTTTSACKTRSVTAAACANSCSCGKDGARRAASRAVELRLPFWRARKLKIKLECYTTPRVCASGF